MSAEQDYTAGPVETVPQGADGEGFDGAGGAEFDEDGQRVPHGMGQSKSSRRRRRKRKSKTSGPETASPGGQTAGAEAGAEAAPLASVQASAESQPSGAVQAAPAGQPAQRQNGQNGQGNGRSFGGAQPNGQGAPGGTKRWKKFRERDRPRGDGSGQQQSAGNGSGNGVGNNGFRGPDTHQPGNSVAGFKRKGGFSNGGKQQRNGGNGGGSGNGRGGFVGPMDHSYRVVNGNVFETSPSTMDPYGNGGGGGRGRSYSAQSDSQPIDYSQGRVIPIAEDAPTRIYFFIDDLFFIAKIQETARKLGVKVAFIKNEKEQIAAITSAAEEERPGLIVFDLNNANAKPLTLIPKLKTKLKKTTSIIGFLSHLQGDLKAKAIEVGCDTVMPRAAFSQNLPNLLRRYGIEEAEEPNFNQ